MKFFVPQSKPTEYEARYQAMSSSVKDQMRTPITSRRIFRIAYLHDKKRLSAEVGQLESQQRHYEVLAIFESKPLVIFARSRTGRGEVTILVNADEVTDIQYFDEPALV